MNFFKQSFYYILLATIILIALIYRFAMKNGKPHCDNFVINVYLYIIKYLYHRIIFVVIYIGKSSTLYELLPLYKAFKQTGTSVLVFVLLLFVSFGSLILLVLQNVFSKEGFLLNHIMDNIFKHIIFYFIPNI